MTVRHYSFYTLHCYNIVQPIYLSVLHPRRAHLGGRRFLRYQIADKFTDVDGTSRLYVGRETLYPGASGWPIPHDAPYKPQLDRWIIVPLEVSI